MEASLKTEILTWVGVELVATTAICHSRLQLVKFIPSITPIHAITLNTNRTWHLTCTDFQEGNNKIKTH